MDERRHAADRWSASLAAAATLVLGLGLVALGAMWPGHAPPSPQPATAAGIQQSAGTAPPLRLADGLAPAWLRIPAIDVEVATTELGLTPQGAMEVPAGHDYDLPGWYVHGPRPGELGPAVLGGHVDSRSGPSVFHRLGELEPGDKVEVGYPDGTVARFAVERAQRYPKDAFPFSEVFDDTEAPELRLITCGGAFDRGARSYDDNLVVFATYLGATGPFQRTTDSA